MGPAFNVTNSDTFDFQPFSPGGKKIAWVYEGTTGDSDIYTINTGGRCFQRNQLCDRLDAKVTTPSMFPTTSRTMRITRPMKKVAYTGYNGLGSDDGEDYDHEIYTINVGGGGKSQVTNTTNSSPPALLGGDVRSSFLLWVYPEQLSSRGGSPEPKRSGLLAECRADVLFGCAEGLILALRGHGRLAHTGKHTTTTFRHSRHSRYGAIQPSAWNVSSANFALTEFSGGHFPSGD